MDTTYDDCAFIDDIPESERDRNIRANERMGYTVMGDGPGHTFREQPPSVTPMDPPPFITVSHAFAEMVESAKLPLIETPFSTLNEMMTLGYPGLVAGQNYNVVSQTGRGKTPFVGQIGRYGAECGFDVVSAFYEASGGYSIARAVAPLLNVSSNAILREPEKYREDAIAKLPERLRLLNRPTLAEIEHAAKYLADKSGKAPIVIIDYAQKLADQIMASQKRPDARLAMSEASSAMLELADETKATVIAVQSMSRMNGRRVKDVRKLAPFELVDVAKESGCVEYDAAGMIVLSLTDDYDGDSRIATMTIAKARYGIECHIEARFDGKSGLWVDKGRVEADPGDDARDVIVAELENGPAANPTELVKRCGKCGVGRGKLFAAIKEMTTETFEITRTERGLELA